MSGVNKLIAFIFLGLALAACADEPQYQRAECIVRVNIDWSTTYGDKQPLIQQILDAYPKAPKMGFNETPPSSTVQGDMEQFLFFQHHRDCENRVSNTEDLLAYVQRTVPGSPDMDVDKGTFQPGVNTIRISGKWWIDSDPSPFDDRK